MIRWLMRVVGWLFSGPAAAEVLNPTKVVRIHGVSFTIRKLNPMHHMMGAQVLHKCYELYGRPGKPADMVNEGMIEKVKVHYRDTFMSGVVSMRSRGVELMPARLEAEVKAGEVFVDNFMTDWSLAEELYMAIVEFTYGKKNFRQFASLAKSS